MAEINGCGGFVLNCVLGCGGCSGCGGGCWLFAVVVDCVWWVGNIILMCRKYYYNVYNCMIKYMINEML